MKRLTPIWIFVLVFAAGAIYLPGLSKYMKLKRKEVELSQQIAHLEAEIEVMKKEEHLLRTDVTHLEEVVRRELGLVKPGEVIYKVVEEEVSNP
jgi:cell division protein FtsB